MDATAAHTADLLREIGQRLAPAGGNPYRARAYSRAADSLRSLVVPLGEFIAADRLREIPGIGGAIAAIIPPLHDTGTHPMLDERIVRAVANPFTTILGHMTGRQLLRRPGYEVDIEAILQACARHGVAVEINANPWRLDLDWCWHRRAVELGCTVSINPDAHSTDGLDVVRWGVLQARKGSVPKTRVLNCLGLGELTRVLAARRAIARSLPFQRLARTSGTLVSPSDLARHTLA